VRSDAERIRFSSAILPPYARRSKSLEVLIPILYLKGVSTGDFEEALNRPSQGRRRAVGPQPSDGSRRLGRRNMRAGAKAVSPMSSAYSSASEPDPKGQPHSGPSLN
jgi:hypothetical protein